MAVRSLKYLPLDELRGHPDNPKAHDLTTIGDSIGRFGYVEPQVLDGRTGLLIAGHGRLEKLRQLRDSEGEPPEGVRVTKGQWLVPVVHGWSSADDTEALAYLVASNQTTIAGGWDLPALSSVLDNILTSDAGWDGLGFDAASLDELIAAGTPTLDPWSNRTKREMPDAAGFVGGQVWQVGDHRVIIGDARDPAVWELVPPCDLLVTDPPYGIGYSGGGGVEREEIEDDEDVTTCPGCDVCSSPVGSRYQYFLRPFTSEGCTDGRSYGPKTKPRLAGPTTTSSTSTSATAGSQALVASP